jgi:hypothetical protein
MPRTTSPPLLRYMRPATRILAHRHGRRRRHILQSHLRGRQHNRSITATRVATIGVKIEPQARR